MTHDPPAAGGPDARRLRTAWSLDPAVTFLNHGSFGACPSAVLAHQTRLRARLERQPVRFFVRDLPELFDGARAALGAFVGAPKDDLVFVRNATTAVNAVLRSLSIAPGDELLVTDHEYAACRNALDFVAERRGARVVEVEIPFPIDGPDTVLDRILSAVTERTRLALVDHVTSQTGLVLPLAKIVTALEGRGVDVLVDGAHAPGMIDLDVEAIGPAYYTANAHKWMMAPKGAAFLYVRPDLQRTVRPTVISHGASAPPGPRSRYQVEFDWTGTDDPTALLSIPFALEHVASLVPGGWREVRERNRALALFARETISKALGIGPPQPAEMTGSLVSFPIRDGSTDPPLSPLYLDPVQDVLMDRFRIEVPIIPWPRAPKRLVRVSAQLYNDRTQYERLGEALTALGLSPREEAAPRPGSSSRP